VVGVVDDGRGLAGRAAEEDTMVEPSPLVFIAVGVVLLLFEVGLLSPLPFDVDDAVVFDDDDDDDDDDDKEEDANASLAAATAAASAAARVCWAYNCLI
jgi:hypothetical protein